MKNYKRVRDIVFDIFVLIVVLMVARALFDLGNFLKSRVETPHTIWDVAVKCQEIKAKDFKDQNWTYEDCIKDLRNALPINNKLLQVL